MNDATGSVQVIQAQQNLSANLLDKANGDLSVFESAAQLIGLLSHHVENQALMFTIDPDVRKIIK